MENKRGSEIFLGVVGVATLIVAIIGATFAFFSVSVKGDNNVEVESYKYSATLSVTRVDDADTKKLIPIKEDVLGSALTSTDGLCVTADGYAGCAIYKLSFKNNGSGPITLNGTLTTKVNAGDNDEKFTNLKYKVLTSTDGTNFALSADAAVAIPGDIDGSVAMPTVSNIPVGDVAQDLYIMVYLNDTGDAQPKEMGVTYSGELEFSSVDGGTGLTATFNV